MILRLIEEGIAAGIAARAPETVAAYRERLRASVEELLQGHMDEARLVQETAIYADRAAIDEELVRLHSHIGQFCQSVRSEGPVGRKLDFIVQEMNREINTIGSKANNAGGWISWRRSLTARSTPLPPNRRILRSPAWRWTARPKSKSCASRCKT